MRKGGHGSKRATRGYVSVLERADQQKRAAAAAAEVKQRAAEASCSADDDIFLDFDEIVPAPASSKKPSPRKSPKTAKNLVAGGQEDKLPSERPRKQSPRKAKKRLADTFPDEPAGTAVALEDPPEHSSTPTQPSNLDPAGHRDQVGYDEHVFTANTEDAEPQSTAAEVEEDEPLEALSRAELDQGLPKALQALRARLMDPAAGAPDDMPLRPSLRQVQQKLEALLSATVDTPGESNSLLLVGPRGVGKTLVLERAILALEAKYNEDPASPTIGFVRLSGLVHTEERAAFRDIARQLCQIFKCQYSKAASLEDNLGFLRDMLKELRKGHKVVVFVLDEFDLFARKPKQTLLYNLLDAMQAADMQAAVIGLSSRHDVTEQLEKRVKSRFSYRRQLVMDPSTSDFESQDEGPSTLLRVLLTVPESLEAQELRAHFNAAAKVSVQDAAVMEQLRLLCDKGYGTPRDLASIAMHAVCRLSLEGSLLRPAHLLEAMTALNGHQDSQALLVAGLAILELFMLVALQRLRKKGFDEPNFEMTYDEFGSLQRSQAHKSVDAAPRPAAFRAFERLLSASLVAYKDPRAESRGGLREFYPVSLLITAYELESGLLLHKSCTPLLLDWLRKDAIASHASDD